MPPATELRGLRVAALMCGGADLPALKSAVRKALDEAVFPEIRAVPIAGDRVSLTSGIDNALAHDPVDLILVFCPVDLSQSPRVDHLVAGLVETPLPGIGELVRGSDALRTEADRWLLPAGGGILRGGLVVVLPARPERFGAVWAAVRSTLWAALQSLEGDVTVELASTERTATSMEAFPSVDPTDHTQPRPGVGVSGVQLTADDRPETDEEEGPQPGWQRALHAFGAHRVPDAWPTLPEAFARIAAARDVLDRAGERGVVSLENGEQCAIFGFPDLKRPGSKVLLVRDRSPLPEVVALHRHPRPVGILVPGDAGLLPSSDLLPDPLAKERTGRETPEGGFLFALEQDAVYVERADHIYRWDGRKEEDMGRPKQAYASLVLKWSQQ